MRNLKRMMSLFSACAVGWGIALIIYGFTEYVQHIEKALLLAFLGVTVAAIGVYLWLLKDDV